MEAGLLDPAQYYEDLALSYKLDRHSPVILRLMGNHYKVLLTMLYNTTLGVTPPGYPPHASHPTHNAIQYYSGCPPSCLPTPCRGMRMCQMRIAMNKLPSST